MCLEELFGDMSRALRPTGRRLAQYMVAMKIRVLAHVLVPLAAENNIGFGFVGIEQKHLDGEVSGEYPANDRDHRGNAGAAGDKADVLRHAVHPMAAGIRSAHQDHVADLPVVEITRHGAGLVPLHRQVEVAGDAGCR